MKKKLIKFSIKLGITLVILGLLAFVGFKIFKSQMQVQPGRVEIVQGASSKQVAEMLEIEGIIKNADFMYYYIKLKNKYYTYKNHKEDDWYPIRFQSGVFHIKKGDIDDVVILLNDQKNIVDESIKVVIPEGKTIEEIGEILEKSKLFKKDEFLKTVNDPQNYNQYKVIYPWLPNFEPKKKYQLEGYLQANTYHIDPYTTPEVVIDTMLKGTDEWYKEFEKTKIPHKLNFNQVITLASVVEAEGKFEQDRPKIAQLFLNRINANMSLQSDMTAAYANGEHKVFMYNKDIQVNSPFNTYKIKGLPIGPIGSPSYSSFKASMIPEGPEFDKIFFYARPSGETFYSKTLAEHEKIIAKYEKEWKELEAKEKK